MSYDSSNVFAKIIRKEISCKVVYEDDEILAFNDVTPAAPIHVLIVPKKEYVSFDDFASKASHLMIADFFKKIKEIANDLGLQKDGYRIISNHGKYANQTVEHFHVHLLSGRSLGGLVPDDNLDR